MNLKLLIVQGRPEGKSLLFPPGEYVFGRGAECHVRPNSDWVSRQHCLLRVTTDEAWLRDLGSRNGTLVNGVRLCGERRLRAGDQVQVGPLVFEVLLDSSRPPAPLLPPSAPNGEDVPVPRDTVIRAHDTAEMNAFTGRDRPVPTGPTCPDLTVPVALPESKR